jgi:autotransporter-associated beta strand protein
VVQRGTGQTFFTNNSNNYSVQTVVENGILTFSTTTTNTKGIEVQAGATAEITAKLA